MRVNGASWVEQHEEYRFLMGRVDDEDFIISGPWDSREALDAYAARLERWVIAAQTLQAEADRAEPGAR
jgi:hypothetical protein